VTVSFTVARPSDPPNSSSATSTSTQAVPEGRPIVAAPRVPGPAAPPAQPTAVPKPPPPLAVVSPSASPAPIAAPARLGRQSDVDDDDDDDEEDDC
jgi:hypothetical protein